MKTDTCGKTVRGVLLGSSSAGIGGTSGVGSARCPGGLWPLCLWNWRAETKVKERYEHER